MSWLKDRQEQTENLQKCLTYCAFYYANEPDRERAYPFLVGAGVVYQTLVGKELRSSGLLIARDLVARFAENTNALSSELAIRLAKLDSMTRDFGLMKTGIWASTKSKGLLYKLCPDLLSAIQNCDPAAVAKFASSDRS